MVVWVGLVCFVLGANLGFLVAGLMRIHSHSVRVGVQVL